MVLRRQIKRNIVIWSPNVTWQKIHFLDFKYIQFDFIFNFKFVLYKIFVVYRRNEDYSITLSNSYSYTSYIAVDPSFLRSIVYCIIKLCIKSIHLGKVEMRIIHVCDLQSRICCSLRLRKPNYFMLLHFHQRFKQKLPSFCLGFLWRIHVSFSIPLHWFK